MKNAFLFIGSILLIFILFIIPGVTDTMWLSLALAGGMAVILIFLYAYFLLKKRPAGKHLRTPVIFVGLMYITAISASLIAYQQDKFHHEMLVEVRSQIDLGILTNNLYKIKLELLEEYHNGSGVRGFDELFLEKYENDITKDSLLISNRFYPDDMTEEEIRNTTGLLRILELSTDRIVISGESVIGKGVSPGFKNNSGMAGRIQLLGILTKEGISYERQN